MSSKHKNLISLTDGELELVIEAVGAYKPRLRSKATRMAIKRGVNHLGKSHQRLSKIQTAQRKLSEANGHKPVGLPEGMYGRHKGHRRKNSGK